MYDADLMVFEFTMRNGEQIVHCQISNAALGNLAGRWRCGERDVPAEFEAHRKLIEGAPSFRAAVLYFGYSLCDEVRLRCPRYSMGARAGVVRFNGAHDNGN